MDRPLVTAAMIVRDEAAHLPDCLRSITDVVDEIVIVDTGSVDDTVEIARSFGARIAFYAWDGSFAPPRNLGLDMASGEWILYIDADERLRPIPRETVHECLSTAEEISLRVRLTPFRNSTPYWEYRLWRSDPRIRFAGRMHEKVAPVIGEIAAADGRPIGESPLWLDHVGYDGDQTRKHRRNLPLLRARLAEDPSDAYNWRHLSIVLAGLGDIAASDEALDRAVTSERDVPTHVGAIVFSEAIRRGRERGDDVDALVIEATRRYPDSLSVVWQRVMHEIDTQRYGVALRKLDRFDIDPDHPAEDTIAYGRRLFLVDAAEARGICLFKLGRYAEAAAAYAQAEANDPADAGHRVRRLLAEHLAGSGDLDRPLRRGAREDKRADDVAARWLPRQLLSGVTLDVAGVPIRCTATDAMRAHAMHRLISSAEPTAREPVASVRFGRHPIHPPQREPDEDFGATRVWYGETMSATHDGRVGARADGAGAEVGGIGLDLSRAFSAIAPYAIARTLAAHGRFLLHGAAVRRRGAAILCLGGSGAGKSTFVYGALAAGWELISDDLVVLAPSPDGPILTGLPRPMHVPAEVVVDGIGARGDGEDPRGRIELDFSAWVRGSAPVAAVAVIGHGPKADAIVDDVDRADLFGLTVASMMTRFPPDVRAFLPIAAAIGDLPTLRLRHGGDTTRRAAGSVAAMSDWFDGGRFGRAVARDC